MTVLRVSLAQINPTVGDLSGNRDKIIENIKRAYNSGSHIVCFPELSITGYPPEDLILKPAFVNDNMKVMNEIVKNTPDMVAIFGFIDQEDSRIYNAASVAYKGTLCGVYRKVILPNYGVFDEKRYFRPGGEPLVFTFGHITFGVNICEDIWLKEGPTKLQSISGASLIFNLSASPYQVGKQRIRKEMLSQRSKEYSVFICYTNIVGGQDEIVFDGGSMILDNEGRILAEARQFEEELLTLDVEIDITEDAHFRKRPTGTRRIEIEKELRPISGQIPSRPSLKEISREEEIYSALVLGLRDYVRKNGFEKVVLGLSGGIDSSLVAVLAEDALGRENVKGVFMPSRYTSSESREDVYELKKNLGIELIEIPIEPIFSSYLESLKSLFQEYAPDVTEENIQARIRGNLLMALSNKFGWLLLTTGNKSELSVGYATLYGDMAGGFAPIKDLLKTEVYKVARYRNSIGNVIPKRILEKEPSAELRPNQKDTDSLPPYEVLDPILKLYVEEDKELEDIVSSGFDPELVKNVLSMVDRSEYKRRQSPPGIKITQKAFGKDRRMPITNGYRGSSGTPLATKNK